jgi:hypothetical protein
LAGPSLLTVMGHLLLAKHQLFLNLLISQVDALLYTVRLQDMMREILSLSLFPPTLHVRLFMSAKDGLKEPTVMQGKTSLLNLQMLPWDGT